jgi:hypothetical protein
MQDCCLLGARAASRAGLTHSGIAQLLKPRAKAISFTPSLVERGKKALGFFYSGALWKLARAQ